MGFFHKIKSIFFKMPAPKIQLRYKRKRTKKWIKCQCTHHTCLQMSQWSDNLCVRCWQLGHDMI